MIVTDNATGKQWEFVGYRPPKLDGKDYLVNRDGFFLPKGNPPFSAFEIWRPYPAPKQYTFGGVVFEEAGPARVLEAGEWFLLLGDGSPCCAVDRTIGVHIPLRPVRVEAK